MVGYIAGIIPELFNSKNLKTGIKESFTLLLCTYFIQNRCAVERTKRHIFWSR